MPYADPAKKRAYQREWAARRRREFLTDQVCAYCAATEDLHLHHRDPNEKMSHRLWSWSARRREDELAKCVVLCRPCHENAHSEARSIEAMLKNPCGTIWAYWRGCRCAPCKAARAEYARTHERKAA